MASAPPTYEELIERHALRLVGQRLRGVANGPACPELQRHFEPIHHLRVPTPSLPMVTSAMPATREGVEQRWARIVDLQQQKKCLGLRGVPKAGKIHPVPTEDALRDTISRTFDMLQRVYICAGSTMIFVCEDALASEWGGCRAEAPARLDRPARPRFASHSPACNLVAHPLHKLSAPLQQRVLKQWHMASIAYDRSNTQPVTTVRALVECLISIHLLSPASVPANLLIVLGRSLNQKSEVEFQESCRALGISTECMLTRDLLCDASSSYLNPVTPKLMDEEDLEASLQLLGLSSRTLLPAIAVNDPLARELGARVGQVIQYLLPHATAGFTPEMRVVVRAKEFKGARQRGAMTSAEEEGWGDGGGPNGEEEEEGDEGSGLAAASGAGGDGGEEGDDEDALVADEEEDEDAAEGEEDEEEEEEEEPLDHPDDTDSDQDDDDTSSIDSDDP